MVDFSPDPRLDGGSAFVVDWHLCHVRLHDDGRFPWLLLLPRVAGVTEIEGLSTSDRAVLAQEIVRASDVVRRMGEVTGRPVEKLNVAAIGNVVPQLHVHVIGRRADDPVWPHPVWGKGTPHRWSADLAETLKTVIRKG